jgi:hypothetical protein
VAEYPDVYADGLTITMSPVGITLTFARSEPAIPGMHETASQEPVARIRCSREFAQGIRDLLGQALAAPAGGSQTITH